MMVDDDELPTPTKGNSREDDEGLDMLSYINKNSKKRERRIQVPDHWKEWPTGINFIFTSRL